MKEVASSCSQKSWAREAPSSDGDEDARAVHPRGDRKSAEAIENRRDSGVPLHKRVRNRMKLLGLQGCDRKQRS